MKRTTAIAWICISLGLAGCATLSKDECMTVDWRTVGYEDGVAGQTGDRIGLHRKACADHGVAPDLNAYQAGRAEGLRDYCQPRNGYRVGLSGAAYGGPCPADLAPAFSEAYDAGRELYVREHRVEYATERLAEMRIELLHLEKRVASAGFYMVSDGATNAGRTYAVLDTRELIERHERLEAEIAELEKDKERYERELDDYRTQVAFTR